MEHTAYAFLVIHLAGFLDCICIRCIRTRRNNQYRVNWLPIFLFDPIKFDSIFRSW